MAEEEYVKVDTLKPRARNVNVRVKVVSKSRVRNVTSRRDFTVHRVVDALVGDGTGCVLLTLWDDKIDEFSPDDVFEIRNGYTSLFRGFLRLNTGKYGEAEKVDREVGEVNTENNLSDKRYEEPFRYRRPRRPFSRRRRTRY